MAWWNNRSIAAKISLSLFVPVLGLLAVSGWLVLDKAHLVRQANDLIRLGEIASQANNLVHELQRERGSSALFIGSEGRQFGPELAAQRKRSNAARLAFEVTAGDAGGAETPSADIRKSLDMLAVLERQRVDVDKLAIDPPQVIKRYTETIYQLLAVVKDLSKRSPNAEVLNHVTAYVNLMEGKERAGQERATGSAGFAAGGFSQTLYLRLVKLSAEERAFYLVFAAHAQPEQRKFFDDTVTGPEVATVYAMRNIAYGSAFSPEGTKGMKAPAWFTAATVRIDRLKLVEDRLAADLRALTGRLKEAANTELAWTASAAAFLSLLALLLAYNVVRNTTKPLLDLAEAMSRLAAGDTSIEVDGVERKDEIGVMSQAVEVFRENKVNSDKLAQRMTMLQRRFGW